MLIILPKDLRVQDPDRPNLQWVVYVEDHKNTSPERYRYRLKLCVGFPENQFTRTFTGTFTGIGTGPECPSSTRSFEFTTQDLSGKAPAVLFSEYEHKTFCISINKVDTVADFSNV